jgi:hypothetical protein
VDLLQDLVRHLAEASNMACDLGRPTDIDLHVVDELPEGVTSLADWRRNRTA